MGFSDLPEDFRQRAGQGSRAGGRRDGDGHDGDRNGHARAEKDWNDEAQNQISALLGQSELDVESEAPLDLAAIRKALAQQEAEPKRERHGSREGRDAQDAFPPNDTTDEKADTFSEDADQEEDNDVAVSSENGKSPKKRLKWLVNLLSPDAEESDVGRRANAGRTMHPDRTAEPPAPSEVREHAPEDDERAEANASPAPVEAKVEPREPERESVSAEPRESEAADGVEAAEQISFSEPEREAGSGPEAPAEEPLAEEEPLSEAEQLELVLSDPQVKVLLMNGIVTLPQALAALNEWKSVADVALWRVLVDVPGVNRSAVFERIARDAGYEPVALEDSLPSAELMRATHQLLDADVQEDVLLLDLLPLELDVSSRPYRLTVASHDPTHPDVQAFADEPSLQVELRYASEETVQDRLAALMTPGRPETVEPRPAEDDELEAIDLDWTFSTDEREDVDVQWKAFSEREEDAAPQEMEWKPLAELEASRKDDRRPAHDEPETSPATHQPQASDDVLVAEDEPEVAPGETRRWDVDAGSGDRHGGGKGPEDPPSFDGSPVDLSDTPVPDVADWTMRKQEEASEEASSDEPVQAQKSESTEKPKAKAPRYDHLPNVDLEKIRSKDRVMAALMRKDVVSELQIRQAQYKQYKEETKEPLWRVLTTVEGVPREQIFEAAAKVYAFPIATIKAGKPDPDFARSVMETFEEGLRETLLELRVVPYEVDLDQQTGAIKVVFVTHDPTRPDVHRVMQKLKLERFEVRYAPESAVASVIVEAFPRKNEYLERLGEEGMAFDLGTSYDEASELVDEDALEAEISRSKLINLFEATLVEAVRQGASDVHIWPNATKQVEIHFRVDGRLQCWHVEDKIHPEALIAVIKDNSMNVDRFERDAAQDGFIQRWIDEALIRFRVSVLPIANASQDVRSESIVIRVLDDRKVIKDLRKLGLNELAYERFSKAIRQPHGMVILTGPTGSGKTTTLYAALHEVISPEVNVLTVEDPVEYILPGVRQIKLNNKLGLEGALRSILRHDPDIVMVGEMRDKHTAELAIKLANTGHLTFSTLHTNDAASAVTRLYKMGIEPFLIAYAINLVVAQRLIRRLCTECKQVDPDPDPVLLKNLGFTPDDIESTTFYVEGEDEHCPKCKGLGYKGRRAVTEAMYFSREIRHLIADSEGKLDEQEIKEIAVKQGMMTLQDSARHIVMDGDTSIMEMLRVIASDE